MWLHLFATACIAERRERPYAAAMRLSATISADVQARSERRTTAKNLPSEVLEARSIAVAKRYSHIPVATTS
jgi:hypothetical protein